VLAPDAEFHWKDDKAPKQIEYIDMSRSSYFESYGLAQKGLPLYQGSHRIIVWNGPEELESIKTRSSPVGDEFITYECLIQTEVPEKITSRLVCIALISEINRIKKKSDSYQDGSGDFMLVLDYIANLKEATDAVRSSVDVLKDFIRSTMSEHEVLDALVAKYANRDKALGFLDKLLVTKDRSVETPNFVYDHRNFSVPMRKRHGTDD
jgi:hypothetical protein